MAKPFFFVMGSERRDSRVIGNGMANAAARAIGLLASLYIISASLPYLGQETFGIWMAVISFVTMLSFADLGLGNGLINAVAQASGRDNSEGIRQATSNTFLMLSLIALIFIAFFFLVAVVIPWETLFKVKSIEAAKDVYPILSVVAVCFALGLPLLVAERVQIGLQMGYIPRAYDIAGAFFSVIGIIGAIGLDASPAQLVAAQLVPPLVLRGVNSLVFWRKSSHLAPRVTDASLAVIRKLISIGGLFFVLQIAVAVAFQSDNLIIARLIGAEAVAVYAVTLKLFIIPSTLIGFFTLAQWPAYAEASTRGDANWIRLTVVRTSMVALIFSLGAALGLYLTAKPLIRLWVGEGIQPPDDLILGMAIWSVMLAYGAVASTILNGLGVVKFQVITASLMAISNVIISILLVAKIGISGAVYGSILAYSIFTVTPTTVYLSRRIMARKWKAETKK